MSSNTKKVRFQTQAERDAVSRVAVWRTERFVKHLSVELSAREVASELANGHQFSLYRYGEYKEALTNRCLPGLASQSDKSVEKTNRSDDEDDTSEEEAEERLIIQDALEATSHLDKSPKPSLLEVMLTEPNQAYALRSSSLYVFPEHTTFRIFLYNVVKHRVFEGIILAVIIFNSLILAVEPEIISGAGQGAFDAMDTFITVAFSIELVLKIAAFGFALHKGAYLRDGWNCLDGFIMLTTYISLGLGSAGVGGTDLTALRTFRVIRPLRSMNAVKGLKILVRSLSGSVMKLSPVLIMLFLALFVFAILSVQLFGGAFSVWCVDDFTGEIGAPCKLGSETVGYWGASCPFTNQTCREVGNVVYGDYNFDNVLTGMLLLFTMTTFDGWTGILNTLFASVGVITFLFFVIVTLIVGFIVPNLVIAVINLEYGRAQQRDREYDVRHSARVRRLTQQKTNQYLLTQQAVTMREKYRAEKEEMARMGFEMPQISSSFDAINRRKHQERMDELMSGVNNLNRDNSINNNNSDQDNSFSGNNNSNNSGPFDRSPPNVRNKRADMSASRSVSPQQHRMNNNNNSHGAVSIRSPDSPNFRSLPSAKSENDKKFPKLWDIDFVETIELPGGHDDDDDDAEDPFNNTFSNNNHRRNKRESVDLTKPVIIKPSHEKPAEMAAAWINFDEDAEEEHRGPSLAFLRGTVMTSNSNNNNSNHHHHFSPLASSDGHHHHNHNPLAASHDPHHQTSSSATTGGILIPGADPINNPHKKRRGLNQQNDEQSYEHRWKAFRKKWNGLRDWCHEFTEGYERSVAGRLALVSGGESDFSEVSSNDTELEQFATSSKGEETSSSVQNLAAAEAGVEQSSSRFAQFIIICIILNTGVLASQHYGQPDWLFTLQDVMNLFFTVVFAIEMALRLMSLGFEKYLHSSFNCLDGVIVISSLIELGLSGGSVLSVFRALRLLRVLKLLKQFPTIRALVRVAFAAMKDTLYLLLIILLYLFIFALLGNSLFGGAVAPDEENRTTFNSFADSFFTAFQLLSQDLWAPLMYKTMEATNAAAALFFIIQIFFGSFVLLAMFLSILVENFNRKDQRRFIELEEDEDGEHVDANMFKQNMLDSHVVRKIYSQGTVEDEEGDDVGVNNAAFLRFLPEQLRRDLVRAQEYESELETKMLNDYKRRQSRLGSLRLHAGSIGMNDDGPVDAGNGPLHGEIVDDVSSPFYLRADPSVVLSPSASAFNNNNNNSNFDENPDPFAAINSSNPTNINPLSATAATVNVNNNSSDIINNSRRAPPKPTDVPEILHREGDDADGNRPRSPTWYEQLASLWQDPDDKKNPEADGATNRLNSNITVSNIRAIEEEPPRRILSKFILEDAPNRPKTSTMRNSRGKVRPDQEIYGEIGAGAQVPDSMLPRELKEARLKRKQSQNIFFAPPPRRIKDIVPAIILFHEGPSQEDKPPKERNVTCARCGEIYAQPLPSAPLIAPPDPEMFHSLQCHRIRLRKAKEKILNAMKNIVNFYIANDEEQNPEKVEAILCCAWSVKCMTNVTTEEILEKDSPWHTLESEIQEELDVLALRTGEEELGKSLVAYAFACIPVEHTTNGGVSLWVFDETNPVRMFFSRLVWNPIFEYFILFSIICSSILLAMQNPLHEEDSTRSRVVYWLSLVFTIIFTIEAVAKIIAFGFVFHQGAYLRDLWNWLDFIVVIVSLISDTRVTLNFRVLRILKTFRALRPLRILNRNSNLKTTAYAMAENLKAIANVALLMLIALFIFAILAVQLFGGKFQSCSDPSIFTRLECNGTWIDPNSEVFVRGPPNNDSATYPLEIPRLWRSEPRNFDDVGLSLLTLFQISTSEAWSEILWRSFDACSEDAVIRNCSKEQGLFFVGFFAIAGFFLTQLFVSFIIHNYDMVQESINGANSMTEEQKIWVQTQQLLVNLRPFVAMVPEDDTYAQWIYSHIVSKPFFDPTVAVFIVTDILSIALYHYNMSDTFVTTLQAFNIFFQVVFTIEAFLKISAFRIRYFKNSSNQFDFFLVLIGFVGLAATNVQGLVVLRVFRFLRILRLLRGAQGVQILLETIVYSLPSIANMGAFIVLITFCFGVLGVDLLAELYIPPDADVLDNRYNNFQQLDYALMLLYRFLTLEDWIGALKDTMIQDPKCASDRSCGSSGYALYFCAFIIINSYVILNLVMAIILVNFELTMKLTGANVRLGQFHKFVDIWSEYDNATLQLETNMLPLLLYRLGFPLGISRKDSRNQIMRRLKSYFIPEHGGKIHFIEVLLALAQGSKKTDLSARDQREFSERLRSTFPELLELPVYRHNQRTLTADLYFAQSFMAAAYRRNDVVERQLPRLRAERRETMRNFCERHRKPVPEPRVFMRIPLRLGASRPDRLSTSDGNAQDISVNSQLGQKLLAHAYRRPTSHQDSSDGSSTTTAMFNMIMETLNSNQQHGGNNNNAMMLRSPTSGASPIGQSSRTPSPRKFDLDRNNNSNTTDKKSDHLVTPHHQIASSTSDKNSAGDNTKGTPTTASKKVSKTSSTTKKTTKTRTPGSKLKTKKQREKEQKEKEQQEKEQQQQEASPSTPLQHQHDDHHDKFVVRVQSPDGTQKTHRSNNNNNSNSEPSSPSAVASSPPLTTTSPSVRSTKNNSKNDTGNSKTDATTPATGKKPRKNSPASTLPPIRSVGSTQQEVQQLHHQGVSPAAASLLSPSSLQRHNADTTSAANDGNNQQRPRSYSDTSSIHPINNNNTSDQQQQNNNQQQQLRSALKVSPNHSRSSSSQGNPNANTNTHNSSTNSRVNTPLTPRHVNFADSSAGNNNNSTRGSFSRDRRRNSGDSRQSAFMPTHEPQSDSGSGSQQQQPRPQTAPTQSAATGATSSSSPHQNTTSTNNNNQTRQVQQHNQDANDDDQNDNEESEEKSGSRPFSRQSPRIEDQKDQEHEEEEEEAEEFIEEEEEEQDENTQAELSQTPESVSCEQTENHEQVGRWALNEEEDLAFEEIHSQKFKSYAIAFLETDRQDEIRTETRLRNDIELQEGFDFTKMFREFSSRLSLLQVEQKLDQVQQQAEPKLQRVYDDFEAEHGAIVRQCWYQKHLLDLTIERRKLEKDFEVLAESTFVDEEKLERFAILDQLQKEGNFLRKREKLLLEGLDEIPSKMLIDEEDSWNALLLQERSEETKTRRLVLTRGLQDVETAARSSIITEESATSRKSIERKFIQEYEALLEEEYKKASEKLDNEFSSSLSQIQEDEDSDRLMIMMSFKKQIKAVVATIHRRERLTLEDEETKIRKQNVLRDEMRIFLNLRDRFVSERKYLKDKEDEAARKRAIAEQKELFAKQRLEVEKLASGHSRDLLENEEAKDRKMIENAKKNGAISIRTREYKLAREQFCETETETRSSVLITAEQQRSEFLLAISSSLHKMAVDQFNERESCIENEQLERSSIHQQEGESNVNLSSMSNTLYEQSIAEYFAAIRRKTETKLNALQKRETAERGNIMNREQNECQEKWNCPVCSESPPYRLSRLANDVNENPNGMGFEKLRFHLRNHKIESQKLRMHQEALRTETVVSRSIAMASAYSTYCLETFSTLSDFYLARARETYKQLSASDVIKKSLGKIREQAMEQFADEMSYFDFVEATDRVEIEEQGLRGLIQVVASNQPLQLTTVDVDERDPLVISLEDTISGGLSLEKSFASRRREQRPLLEEERLLDGSEIIQRRRLQGIIARHESSDDEDCYEPLNDIEDEDENNQMIFMLNNTSNYASPNAAKAATVLRALSNSAPPTRTSSPTMNNNTNQNSVKRKHSSFFASDTNNLMDSMLDADDNDEDNNETARIRQQRRAILQEETSSSSSDNNNNDDHNSQQQHQNHPQNNISSSRRRLQNLLTKLQIFEGAHRDETADIEASRRDRMLISFKKGLESYSAFQNSELDHQVKSLVRLEAVRRQGIADSELNERVTTLYRSPRANRVGLNAIGAIPKILPKSPSRVISRATSLQRQRERKLRQLEQQQQQQDDNNTSSTNRNRKMTDNSAATAATSNSTTTILNLSERRRKSLLRKNPYYDGNEEEEYEAQLYQDHQNINNSNNDDDEDYGSPHRRLRDVIKDRQEREQEEEDPQNNKNNNDDELEQEEEKEEQKLELSSFSLTNNTNKQHTKTDDAGTTKKRREYQGLPADRRLKQILLFQRQIENMYDAVEMRREYLANSVLRKIDRKITSQGSLPSAGK